MSTLTEPVYHVVIDTNVLIGYLCPKAVDDLNIQVRSHRLLQAAVDAEWPSLRLYTPAICVSEALGVLDKYRFCKWTGPAKADPSKRLKPSEYREARSKLIDALKTRKIELLQHDSSHSLFSGLISPVNQAYQYRRNSGASRSDGPKVRKPMGGADCQVAGIAIHLAAQLGSSSVVLATADQRLSDVISKARSLSTKAAERLGLIDIANAVGLEWNAGIYPTSIDLHYAAEPELRASFGGWPLPSQVSWKKSCSELSDSEQQELIDCWKVVAKRHEITNPDRLAYSAALQEIRTSFADKTRIEVASDQIFWFFVNLRKKKKLPALNEQQES